MGTRGRGREGEREGGGVKEIERDIWSSGQCLMFYQILQTSAYLGDCSLEVFRREEEGDWAGCLGC